VLIFFFVFSESIGGEGVPRCAVIPAGLAVFVGFYGASLIVKSINEIQKKLHAIKSFYFILFYYFFFFLGKWFIIVLQDYQD